MHVPHPDPSRLRLAQDDAPTPHVPADADEERESELLVRLIRETHDVGRTAANEPFLFERNGLPAIRILRGSRETRAILAHSFRSRYGYPPKASTIGEAITALEGEAYASPQQRVDVRITSHEQGVVVDLGRDDGQVIIINRNGWRVTDRSPVLFRRSRLTGELPLPVRGGRLEDLRSLLNIDDAHWPLLIGWAVAAFLPEIAHPVLMLRGTQGNGKSTLVRMLVLLLDPSAAPLRSEPRDQTAWAVSADASWVIAIDNVSEIATWLSDALCKAVTGDGFIRRRLYTDSDLSVLAYRRAVIITSIDVGAVRGDLADRLLLVDLAPIDPAVRRSELKMADAFLRSKPAIFGALLDAVVHVLHRVEQIELAEHPRMADFARVLAALDAEGITRNAYRSYIDQAERLAEEVLESDDVGVAIMRLLADRPVWQGTMSQLEENLEPAKRVPNWPTSARMLSSRLKRLEPTLAKIGVTVTRGVGHSPTGSLLLRLSRATVDDETSVTGAGPPGT